MGIFDLFNNNVATNAAGLQTNQLFQGYDQSYDFLKSGLDRSTTALQGGLDKGTAAYTAGMAPFMSLFNTGNAGTQTYADATGANGTAGFARAKNNFQTSPGYQFQLDQGNENILRNASRLGNSGGAGGTNIDLLNYGQGVANQDYGNYVNRLSPFLNLASTGAQGVGSLSAGMGNMLANGGAGIASLMNTDYSKMADLAYGTHAAVGNAQAGAELANNQANANQLGALFGLGGLGMSMSGMGGAGGGGTFNPTDVNNGYVPNVNGGGVVPGQGPMTNNGPSRWGFPGGGAGGGGGGGSFNPMQMMQMMMPFVLSDIRVKEEVRPVGKLYDGQPVFSYRYKGMPQTHIGLIAQKVEEAEPDAVMTLAGELAGIKAVDYRRATNAAARMAEFV